MRLEPLKPISAYCAEFKERVEAEAKDSTDSLESWLKSYFGVLKDAKEKIEKKEPDALEYALAVLRELPRTEKTILRIQKGPDGDWYFGDQLAFDLMEARVNFERFLLSEIQGRTTLSIRPEVLEFAHEMESELYANEKKGGWTECDFEYLFNRLKEEVGELPEAIHKWQKKEGASLPNLVSECADVANFAMMIADIARKRSLKRMMKTLPDIPTGGR
jgi:NTP pyrophosphatase (non-canonical NTP hydrolase)